MGRETIVGFLSLQKLHMHCIVFAEQTCTVDTHRITRLILQGMIETISKNYQLTIQSTPHGRLISYILLRSHYTLDQTVLSRRLQWKLYYFEIYQKSQNSYFYKLKLKRKILENIDFQHCQNLFLESKNYSDHRSKLSKQENIGHECHVSGTHWFGMLLKMLHIANSYEEQMNDHGQQTCPCQ